MITKVALKKKVDNFTFIENEQSTEKIKSLSTTELRQLN